MTYISGLVLLDEPLCNCHSGVHVMVCLLVLQSGREKYSTSAKMKHSVEASLVLYFM